MSGTYLRRLSRNRQERAANVQRQEQQRRDAAALLLAVNPKNSPLNLTHPNEQGLNTQMQTHVHNMNAITRPVNTIKAIDGKAEEYY